MPLPKIDPKLAVACALLLMAAGATGIARAQPVSAPASPASAWSREHVDAAASALREAPGLVGTRSVRELRLKDSDEEPPPSERETPAWTRWLVAFADWFNETGRWLVWLLMAVALAVLLLRLRRWFVSGARDDAHSALQLPTQVRGLAIAPESLPDDVGAAAWALWQRGEQLAALSLLYRGALSHLVHGHAVPIRGSSTEGDCLRLAAPRLEASAWGYLQNLVAAWRQAVYAARWPAAVQVQQLCNDFDLLKPSVPEGRA